MLVADYLGNIYHFDLNGDRTRLLLRGPLNDTVANTSAETDGVRFGQNFGIITDMQIGPDGDLYIVSMSLGKIFRVSPA